MPGAMFVKYMRKSMENDNSFTQEQIEEWINNTCEMVENQRKKGILKPLTLSSYDTKSVSEYLKENYGVDSKPGNIEKFYREIEVMVGQEVTDFAKATFMIDVEEAIIAQDYEIRRIINKGTIKVLDNV